jgi:hypothetical protein
MKKVREDGDAIPSRLDDQARRDIELVLLGAALVTATPEQVLEKVPMGHLSNETQLLFAAVANSRKSGSVDPLVTKWLAARSIVIEKGDDLLTAIMRRFLAEAEMKVLEGQSFKLRHLMVHGEPKEVIQLLKNILIELGELPGNE